MTFLKERVQGRFVQTEDAPPPSVGVRSQLCMMADLAKNHVLAATRANNYDFTTTEATPFTLYGKAVIGQINMPCYKS